jgi:hypothetical protein
MDGAVLDSATLALADVDALTDAASVSALLARDEALALGAATPDEPPPTLLDLAADTQFSILRLLDPNALCRYTELTCKTLARLDSGTNELASSWVEKREQLQGVVRAEGCHNVAPQTSPALEKGRFVREQASMQQRCPRCGRQASAGPAAADTPVAATGKVFHGAPVHKARFMHLCDWLVPKEVSKENLPACVTPTKA